MAETKNIIGSSSQYTRSYSGLRGVLIGADCSTDTSRLSYAENMYRDYESGAGGVVESVPGFRRLCSLGERIWGIFRYRRLLGEDYILVHAGNSLYRFLLSEKDSAPKPQKIATLEPTRTSGFNFGGRFYILDGVRILCVFDDGSCAEVGSDEASGYEPTVFVEGKAYEQANLICDRFREEYHIGDANGYVYATDGLIYSVLDPDLLTCAVCGIEDGFAGELNIPGNVRIGDSTYRVVEISDRAFSYQYGITSVKINEGVERIGKLAFYHAEYVTKVATPRSLYEIDNAAFADCARMKDIYLEDGLAKLGSVVFSSCIQMETVHYSADGNAFNKIEGIECTMGYEIAYEDTSREITLSLDILSDAEEITEVTLGGEPIPFTKAYTGGRLSSVLLHFDSSGMATGKDVVIRGISKEYYSAFAGSANDSDKIDGKSAILGCKICEAFDGRIFLSGNPKLPNTVFYSSLSYESGSPLWFGRLNYFNDGIGLSPVKTMLAAGDRLAVFKERDDGSGSIFYHYPEVVNDGVIEKIYPVASVHRSICAIGDAISFMDDPVFISPIGIAALERQQLNYERSIVTRSSNVNPDLLCSDLKEACLGIWQGYLVVGVKGEAYLADSRAIFRSHLGNTEYEWFKLSGIGTYKNSTRVYRYASFAPDGFYLHPHPDTVCTNTVYSYKGADGSTHYYCINDGKRYALYRTEEMSGGIFNAAICYFADEDLLFFGTGNGDLCLFNNDKRGVPPERISAAPDFDPEEYKERMGRRIHPDFYDFDFHAPRYAIKTCLDNCGVPHLTKNTVKNSLVVKCRAYSSTELCVEVGTNHSGYTEVASFSPSELNFAELDFSRLSLDNADHHTLALAEREKNWIEKQIALYSEGFRCPIGIYSITFRYTIKGRIKRQ